MNFLKLSPEIKMFKPAKGLMLIDILPYEAGDLNPNADAGRYTYELTFHLHKNIGPSKASVLCNARMLEKACPICELQKKLADEGETDKKTLEALYPRKRQLFWVVNRKDREAGVQLFEFAFASFGKLLAARLESDAAESRGWGSFSHPEKGLSLEVDFEEKKFEKNTFLNARAIDFIDRKRQYDWKFLDDNCPSLESLLRFDKYARVLELLEGNPEEDAKEKPGREDDDKSDRRRNTDDENEKSDRRRGDDDDRPARREREDDDKSERRSDKDWDDDKPRSRREDDDKPRRREDDDDKPRRRDEDDEKSDRRRGDDDDKPRSRREDDEKPRRTEEDEPKKPRRPNLGDDDDDKPARRDDDKPRGRKDEDDEKPSKSDRKGADDWDDDPPKRTGSSRNDDDDKPRRSRNDD